MPARCTRRWRPGISSNRRRRWPQPFELPKDSGGGRTVAILGAGVAGLCAAYELDRAGYDASILEATRRAGGRKPDASARRRVQRTRRRRCRNAASTTGCGSTSGPGRIPHHHVHVIDYCRRFGVALQPYIFASRANLVHSSHVGNGRTVQVRRAYYDLQGHIAEMLDKCVAKPDMDLPIPSTELENSATC